MLEIERERHCVTLTHHFVTGRHQGALRQSAVEQPSIYGQTRPADSSFIYLLSS